MRPKSGILFTAVVVVVGACSGAHETHRDRITPAVVAAPTRPALNVPSLLTLSIDEISRQMGPPHPVPPGFTDPTLLSLVQNNEPMDSAALFRWQDLAIIASYDHHTRRISDLLLLGSNESELMSRAQLKLGAAQYLVLPVFRERQTTQLLGLRVLSTEVMD